MNTKSNLVRDPAPMADAALELITMQAAALRVAVVLHLRDHPGPHSIPALAAALDATTDLITTLTQALIAEGHLIRTREGVAIAEPPV